MTDFERYVTAEEASAALGAVGIPVSPVTLKEQARLRKCPAYKVNGKRRFRVSELLRHFADKAVRHEPAPR